VNLNTFAYNTTKQCQIVSDAELKQWAGSQGFLNGADLTDVMDAMQKARGNPLIASGTSYYDGPYTSVNWQDRANLTSAIYTSQGSVKISVDAGVLENAVGDGNGWYLGSYSSTNQDHCVGLTGFGPASFCCAACGVAVPAGVDPNSFCYLLDTWGTVGVVAASVIESPWVGEAWLRTPTSIPSGDPTPTPTPTPDPVPPSPTPTHRLSRLLNAWVRNDMIDSEVALQIVEHAAAVHAENPRVLLPILTLLESWWAAHPENTSFPDCRSGPIEKWVATASLGTTNLGSGPMSIDGDAVNDARQGRG
jgi:hypothetical protein